MAISASEQRANNICTLARVIDFRDRLEENNSKACWRAHKGVDEQVPAKISQQLDDTYQLWLTRIKWTKRAYHRGIVAWPAGLALAISPPRRAPTYVPRCPDHGHV